MTVESVIDEIYEDVNNLLEYSESNVKDSTTVYRMDGYLRGMEFKLRWWKERVLARKARLISK